MKRHCNRMSTVEGLYTITDELKWGLRGSGALILKRDDHSSVSLGFESHQTLSTPYFRQRRATECSCLPW